jgi:hypothetical protein
MPTRNVGFTTEQDADDLKLTALRIQIKAGIDAIKRGDFAEIEAADLESYLDRLAKRPACRIEPSRHFE